MKFTCLALLFNFSFLVAASQKPKDGTYIFKIAFAEWRGQSLGNTCTVIIKGNGIKVLHNGKGNLKGRKGDVIAQGMIIKHRKTGKWIIGHSKSDANAKEVGDCSDGPFEIDFRNKIFWLC